MPKAIVSRGSLHDDGWHMEDIEVRKPLEGELLVEMIASGICHTDIMIGGLPNGASPIAFYPRVLGHEGSGIVKEVGPGVKIAQAGDPVLLSYTYCSDCEICKAGHYSNCPRSTELNFGGPYNVFKTTKKDDDISGVFFGQSSFASMSIVKSTSVVNVKDLIKSKEELQLLAPLGCGVQTGSGTVINAAKAQPSDVVLVMGLGGVGLSAISSLIVGAKIVGARMIIGLDKVESRLDLAKQLGATYCINSNDIGDRPLVDVIRKAAEGVGPTVTIDSTGVPALINAGLAATRNRGRFCQIGSAPFDFKMEFNAFDFMLTGKEYIGAVEGQAYPPEYVPKMIQWYREGRFPIEKLIKFIPAEDFMQGVKEMHDGTTIKPVICWT